MSRTIPAGTRLFDAAEYLTDEETITEYLNACAEYEDPALLLSALSNVARARGMAAVAKGAGLGRESLYKALAPGAQPRYETIFRVALALGAPMRFGSATQRRSQAKKRGPAAPETRTVQRDKRAVASAAKREPAAKPPHTPAVQRNR